MENLATIAGWSIHILNLLFMLFGGIYIVKTSRTGGKISHMGLFQWGLSMTGAWVFSFTELNKLHLLWIIPIGIFASFTFMGRYIGSLIGYVTDSILTPPHLRHINKDDITDDDYE
jgi:hypothetical protein